MGFQFVISRVCCRKRWQHFCDLPIITQTGQSHDLCQPGTRAGDIKLGAIECGLNAKHGIALEHQVCRCIELVIGDIDDYRIERGGGRCRTALTHRHDLAGSHILEIGLIDSGSQRDDLIGDLEPGA